MEFVNKYRVLSSCNEMLNLYRVLSRNVDITVTQINAVNQQQYKFKYILVQPWLLWTDCRYNNALKTDYQLLLYAHQI